MELKGSLLTVRLGHPHVLVCGLDLFIAAPALAY